MFTHDTSTQRYNKLVAKEKKAAEDLGFLPTTGRTATPTKRTKATSEGKEARKKSKLQEDHTSEDGTYGIGAGDEAQDKD